ncbi:hypothetical protein BJX99DRAFT_264170 [Aspergillus californicus]
MSPWKAINVSSTLPSPAELTSGFTLHAPPSSDLWETPDTPAVFTTPVVYQDMPLGVFKRARVTITANITELYAQGGLALIVHCADGSRKWVKTGMEFMHGRQIVGTVGKDLWPDWSPGSAIPDCETGREMTVEMVRGAMGLEVYEVEMKDGVETRTMIRDLVWVFTGNEDAECWVGAYVAKPLGNAGDASMVVTFRDLVIERN